MGIWVCQETTCKSWRITVKGDDDMRDSFNHFSGCHYHVKITLSYNNIITQELFKSI